MASLVNAIKKASGQIFEAASTAKSNAVQLLAISDKQSKDIKETGLSVLNITEAI
jgi:conjugal transfer/entry exclusion protein